MEHGQELMTNAIVSAKRQFTEFFRFMNEKDYKRAGQTILSVEMQLTQALLADIETVNGIVTKESST